MRRDTGAIHGFLFQPRGDEQQKREFLPSHPRRINIDDLIIHSMLLDQINPAFDPMREGKPLQSVEIS